jgi:3-oxoacyl-[acyl-carrier protein] reductase
MDLQLAGRVALVTGATRGLGRAIAFVLAEEGCKLAVVARGRGRLDELADDLAARGFARPCVIGQDVTATDAAVRIRGAVMDAFGRLDVLVNNAGGSRPFQGLGAAEDWDQAMRLNFHAGRELAHAVVPDMRTRQFGRIINITGGDEPTAINGGVPPNGATHIWSKALSREIGADGITVNCIPPGRLHSEQIDERLLPSEPAQTAWVKANVPAGYIGEPEDLAILVAFLASPKARYISGQVIHIDGGARRFAH